MSDARPSLLIVFYGNPDRYPPTYNAALLFQEHFRVRVICRANADRPSVVWPADLRVDRVGPALPDREKNALGAAAKVREFLGFAWAVRRALAEDRPRVAYAYEPHALVALGMAGRRGPTVYHRHEIEDPGPIDRRSLQGWILYASWKLSKRADLVVFPVQRRAQIHQEITDDPRAPRIVPNFPLRRAFPEPQGWPEIFAARWQKQVILYRGALGPATSIVPMVRALPHLDADVSLRLCGGGSPEFVREFQGVAAELGVTSRLRFDGFVPFDQLNRETQHALVGLALYQPIEQNSVFNATATNKLYEYAACGVPAIVPDRPAYREFLGGESWVEYADPADPRAVAGAVQRLLADRAAYEDRCLAARRAFEIRFNFDAAFAPLREEVTALSRVAR